MGGNRGKFQSGEEIFSGCYGGCVGREIRETYVLYLDVFVLVWIQGFMRGFLFVLLLFFGVIVFLVFMMFSFCFIQYGQYFKFIVIEFFMSVTVEVNSLKCSSGQQISGCIRFSYFFSVFIQVVFYSVLLVSIVAWYLFVAMFWEGGYYGRKGRRIQRESYSGEGEMDRVVREVFIMGEEREIYKIKEGQRGSREK